MKNQQRARDEQYLRKHRYNERIQLKTGTFLHCYCPKCASNLIVDNMVKLVARTQGSSGILELSPYLNVFEHHSTINIQPDSELNDVTCPHCNQSIVHPEARCEACGSRTAEISIAAVHIRVPFLICMREGCHWHGISPDDEKLLIQDSSDEW
ncbi:hypothetical protein JXA40_03845 [bacterium]|nr:hypothetical protein [candidate division CSSED10-310 bacterium]